MTKLTQPIDAQRLTLILNDLRLPAIKQTWPEIAARSDKEGWPAARFLAALAEHEIAERDRRRIERHLGEAKLPPGKTLDSFAFDAVPMISRAQVMAICAGDGWLDQGANLILFGPPGGGKSHLAAAIGLALIENGRRVLFTRTSDLVQKLQVARRELALEAAIARLDKYHLLILDDLAYVTKDQAETSVLFELISAPCHYLRDERRKLPSPRRRPAPYRCRSTTNLRDNQNRRAIDAQRQSNLNIAVATDNQIGQPQHAATISSHPDRRALLIQIVALHLGPGARPLHLRSDPPIAGTKHLAGC